MRKSWVIALILSGLFHPASSVYSQAFDVSIRGVDDGVKTKKQQDFKEALMNARMQLLEREGQNVDEFHRMTNFQQRYDAVEASVRKVLLPGSQVVDIGYAEDGTYQVVLVGKAQKPGEKGIREGQFANDQGVDSDANQIIREALQLYKLGKTKKAIGVLDKANKKDNLAARMQALYVKGLIYASEAETLPRAIRVVDELRTLQPDSPYIAKLETVTTYRHIRYKIVNNEHKIKASKTVVEVRQGNPFSFIYQDETGKRYRITYPGGAVCVNDECGTFNRRGIQDRFAAIVGMFSFYRTCRDWTNYTQAQMSDSAVDKVCVMSIERTDLDIDTMMK